MPTPPAPRPAPRARRLLPWLEASVVLALALGQLGASCGERQIAIMPGVVNSPKNLSLRRELLAYGTKRFCEEMLARSLPLKLRDEDPGVGRFFPQTCFSQNLENQNLFVQFSGFGYAWTNVTKKTAFQAGGAIEYDVDFQLHEGSMYVYFRARGVGAATFKTTLLEQRVVPGAGTPLGGAASPEALVDEFGAGAMKNELARGFTVIRGEDGSVDFALGLVEVGSRPARPFGASKSGRELLANERVEVHAGQRDFAGPFEIDGKGEALYLTAAIDGAPAVDVLVVGKDAGDAWLKTYVEQVPPSEPPSPPLLSEPVFSGATWRRVLPLPKGRYYVVFDNTATAGTTAPTAYVGDDRAAMISYAVERADAP